MPEALQQWFNPFQEFFEVDLRLQLKNFKLIIAEDLFKTILYP
jgi:hypothetical protein